MKVIELRNVWMTYNMGNTQVHALHCLNLSIDKGEFVAIQGPSGSGKSTAMSLVGCLDRATRGTILLEGKDIAKLGESELAHIRGKKIGFVFQKFNLLATLTAQQNVILPMIFQGFNHDEQERRSLHLLTLVGLADRAGHKPNELSGGQQQRVAIARALAVNPELILADEPTGNLDSLNGKQIIELLIMFHKTQGKTIVLVTHDDTLAKYAQRIIYLRDGTVYKEWREKP